MVENLGFYNEITFYKNKVLEILLSDQYLMTLVADEPVTTLPALSMRCSHVYPWKYTLGTTSDASAFITMEMNAEAIKDVKGVAHPAVKKVYLFMYAFCHESIMMVDDAVGQRLGITQRGSRVDLIVARMDELLNGSELSSFGKIGFDADDTINPPATNYYGKVITYTTENFNRWGEKL